MNRTIYEKQKAMKPHLGTVIVLLILGYFAGTVMGLPIPTPQQNQASQGPRDPSETPSQNPPRSPVAIEGPITVIDQPTAAQQKQDADANTRQNVIIVIAFFGFLAASGAYWSARRQAIAAEKTLHIIQRPNVYFSRIQMLGFGPELQPTLLLYFKNGGNTRALDVWISINVSKFKKDRVPTEWECRHASDPQDISTIAAGSEICLPWSPTPPLTPEEFGAIQHGNIWLWVYGSISYRHDLGKTTTSIWSEDKPSHDEDGRELFNYSARYIAWSEPRPKLPSDFWVYNDSGAVTNVKVIAAATDGSEVELGGQMLGGIEVSPPRFGNTNPSATNANSE